jgi:peptidoglycan/LPS O-acetylase OafA/YrhL
MARLKKRTARLLAALAGVAIAAGFMLFGYLMGWDYLLGFFPILTIVVIIVGAVMWILGFSKEKREHPEE